MRLITWNCYRGEARARAALLDHLQPDLIVLQECGKPTAEDDQCLWFGVNSIQGVGILARGDWRLRPAPVQWPPTHSVFPVVVEGPLSFHLLAVWAQQKPSYAKAVMQGLDVHRDYLLSADSVIAGDFNIHPRFNSGNRIGYSTVVNRLQSEFGLVSAFHFRHGPHAVEPPTYYWRWKRDQPFHIDYCFVPEAWTPRIRDVSVGSYSDWADKSDHRPLIVDLD